MAKKISQWLMVSVALMVLAACGGGGGGVDKNTTQQNTPQPTQNKKTITGYVIDDPVVGATIEVYDANGTLLTKEENATDGSGKFSIEVNGTPQKLIASINNKKLYEINYKKDKLLVLSPLTLLGNFENNVSYKFNTLYDYVYTISQIKNILQTKNEDPLTFNELLKNTNKKFILQKLPKNEDKLKGICLYNRLEQFPKKITCVSKTDAQWRFKNLTFKGNIFTFDANQTGTVTVIFDNGITNDINIYGAYQELKSKIVKINKSLPNDITIDNYKISIPEDSINNTNVTIKVLKGKIASNSLGNKILEIKPSKESSSAKPIEIKIPLNDNELYYAQKGELKVVKIDKDGKIILNPAIDSQHRYAIVKIRTFSQLQPILLDDSADSDFFIEQLKENKDFNTLLNSVASENQKKLLQDLENGNDYLKNKLNLKVENKFTISEGLVELYNQYAYFSNIYDSRSHNPKYLEILTKTYKANLNQLSNKAVFDTLKDFFKLYDNGTVSANFGGTSITIGYDTLSKDIDLSTVFKNFAPGLQEMVNDTVSKFDTALQYTKFLVIKDDQIEWVDIVKDLYSTLLKDDIATYAFGVYIDTEKKILENTIKTIKSYSNTLNGEGIELIFSGIAQPDSMDSLYKRFIESPYFNQYFIKNDDNTISPANDNSLKLSKLDLIVLYQIYQKYSAHKTDIKTKKKLIKDEIGFLLSLYEASVYDKSDTFEVTVCNNKKECYFDDKASVLKIVTKKGYNLKNLNIIVKNYHTKAIILNKHIDKIPAESSKVIKGNEIAIELDKKIPLEIEIKGDVYDDGLIHDSKLFPINYNSIVEAYKIKNKIQISRKKVYDNIKFKFTGLNIDYSGITTLYLKNEGNLHQFGKFKINGYVNFIDEKGKVFYGSSFSLFGFNDNEVIIKLNHRINQDAISKLSTNQHIQLSAEFIFDDPKLENKLVISSEDYGIVDFYVPYNPKIDNNFIENSLVDISLTSSIYSKGEETNTVELEKKDAIEDKVTKGRVEIWDTQKNLKLQTVNYVECVLGDDRQICYDRDYRKEFYPNYQIINYDYHSLLDINIKPLKEGIYTIKVFIDGVENSKTFNLIKNKPPVAVIKASKTKINKGEKVTLDFSNSKDPDGSIKSYTLKDDNGNIICNKTKCIISPIFTKSYYLTVTDDKGATASASIKINVNNSKGYPIAKLTTSKRVIKSGESIILDATYSNDPNGSIVKYAIKDSSGNTVCKKSICTVKPVKSTTYTLTVTDNDNLSSSDSVTITVKPKPITKGTLTLKASPTTITLSPDENIKDKTRNVSISLAFNKEKKSCDVLVNGKSLGSSAKSICNANGSVSVDLRNFLNLGSNTIKAKVTDKDNINYTKEQTITVSQNKPNYKLSLIDENYKDNTIIKPSDINGYINKWWKLKNISNHEAKDLILIKDSAKECNLQLPINDPKTYTLAVNETKTFSQSFQAPSKDGTYSCYFKVKDKDGHSYTINGSSDIWIKVQYKSDALLVNSDFDSEIKVNTTAKMIVQVNSGNKPYSISINWGDGSNNTYTQDNREAVYSHKYTKVGTYQVSLKVTDMANKEYNQNYTIKVSNSVSLTTSWIGVVDAIKQNGSNTGDKSYPITVTNKDKVSLYSVNYSKKGDDKLYYTGFKLPVPQGLITLDKKLRVSYITQIDTSTGFWNYDREHWLKTDTKKYGAVIEDAKDGMNENGVWIVKYLDNGTRVDINESAFVDFVVEHKGYSGYALEIDNGNVNTYQYKQNDNGSFTKDLEQINTYSDSVGNYLSQIHFDCKGKCKLIIAKLQYDLNNDGDFDDANETLILNTPSKVVNWEQFAKGGDDENDNNDKVDLKKGLVAHYEFEENAKDSSGNGNDGTEHGGVSYVDGVIGKAAKFDGVDDYIEIKHSKTLNISADITLCAWVNLNKLVGKQDQDIIINKDGDYNIAYELGIHDEPEPGIYDSIPKYNLAIFLGNNGLPNHQSGWTDGGITFKQNQWKFICVTYDMKNVKTYENTHLRKKYNTQGYIATNDGTVRIGARGNGNEVGSYFNGKIDDLRIYNRALNEAEIKELYKMKK